MDWSKMISAKNYPLKILDNLYIISIANSSENEEKEFLKLSEIEMMETLILKEPSVRHIKSKKTKETIYTPSFGNFIISPSEKGLLKLYDFHYTIKKSEELFQKFREEYLRMIFCYDKLEKLINSRYGL
jgi:hypothetical protein